MTCDSTAVNEFCRPGDYSQRQPQVYYTAVRLWLPYGRCQQLVLPRTVPLQWPTPAVRPTAAHSADRITVRVLQIGAHCHGTATTYRRAQ